MGQHTDADGDGLADRTPAPRAADDEELSQAVRALAYRHSDPVTDQSFPDITAHDGLGSADDAFPEGWGSTPTERDQAAIEAGNA